MNPELSGHSGDHKQVRSGQTLDLHIVDPALCVIVRSQKKDISQTCSLCKSLSFCPTCHQCPQCCQKSTCGGGHLQKFWQVWVYLGSNLSVVSILREGYHHPFKVKPPLTRSSLIVSGYANPIKKKTFEGCSSGTDPEGGCGSDHQVVGPRLPSNDSDCPGVAQHAMVLGSGQHVSSHPSLSSKGGEPSDSAIQRVSAQGSPNSKSACSAPRATAIQQEHFSNKVAARIEAPQRRSPRNV